MQCWELVVEVLLSFWSQKTRNELQIELYCTCLCTLCSLKQHHFIHLNKHLHLCTGLSYSTLYMCIGVLLKVNGNIRITLDCANVHFSLFITCCSVNKLLIHKWAPGQITVHILLNSTYFCFCSRQVIWIAEQISIF